MLCPDADRTRLLKEQVANLQEWLEKDNNTEMELAYWIPKYLLMRGNKPLAEMGDMSDSMYQLAKSQDKIGWRRFTEGCISKELQKRQSFHLQMSSSRLNGSDWTRQLISRILQITHSQWKYRNILLHNKTNGYLHNKKAEELANEIHRLAELEPDDVPTDSHFFIRNGCRTTNKIACGDSGLLGNSSDSGKEGKSKTISDGRRSKEKIQTAKIREDVQ
jgi:mannose-6-phosphate isomerase class I